jgi:hypothetical protein
MVGDQIEDTRLVVFVLGGRSRNQCGPLVVFVRDCLQ